MKRVPCSYAQCGERRRHWSDPETPRGTQYLEVPEEHEGPAYCSISCALAAGALSVRYEPREEQAGG